MPAKRKSTMPPAEPEPNLDPLSGEPGAHPVGTSIGAATGGATGAAIGMGGGPVGVVIGTVVGALIGGYAGKGVAEGIDPTIEDNYWRENHRSQPYANTERSYDDYAAAYRTGYSGYRLGKTFEEREADMREEYERLPEKGVADPASESTAGAFSQKLYSTLNWTEAREAARAAYERLARGESRKPGDTDPLPAHPGQIG